MDSPLSNPPSVLTARDKRTTRQKRGPRREHLLLRRGQGRPRKDGSGPFKPIPSSESPKEEEEESDGMPEIAPPQFQGKQRETALKRIKGLERESTMDLYRNIHKELLKMEDIRQRAKDKSFQSKLNGQLKIGIYIT